MKKIYKNKKKLNLTWIKLEQKIILFHFAN